VKSEGNDVAPGLHHPRKRSQIYGEPLLQ